MIQKKQAVVPPDQDGQRFDLVAAVLFSELSRKKIKSIIDAGGAYLNKKRILIAKYVVKSGDRLEIFWEEKAAPVGAENENAPRQKFVKAFAAKNLSSDDILFENENFLVINKPAGIASQATLISSTDTIVHAVQALNPEKYPLAHLFMVHRLDKDTSGLLLLARNVKWQKYLEELFRGREVEKTYEALCLHIPKVPKGDIAFPIAKNSSRENTYYAVLRPGAKGGQVKPALTHYRVERAFEKADCAHVVCYPKTGRTHQIRVHLQALGCPIMGDKTYAQNVVGHGQGQSALRQMLHARKICFKGPDGTLFEFEAPLPSDFLECLQGLDIANG